LDSRAEDLLRSLTPQALGALMRRGGQFDDCEDALQEALLAATVQWPEQGMPDNPRAWLITVASRKLTDQRRSESARRQREATAAGLSARDAEPALRPGADQPPDGDDTLALLLLCCQPSLPTTSQVALTLRAVGGLTTAQIARAFLVPEATMAQRISRAKARIKTADAPFRMPPGPEQAERLQVVLHVLYLIFNEGYSATAGPDVHRSELTREAIRLARVVHRLLPDDGEAAGLLALMLLTDARRAARTRPDGTLVPLQEQDRRQWDHALIAEGVDLISGALSKHPLGPYQLQAAIAALHDEAARSQDTDWPQILLLYELLAKISPSPVVTLNHAVAAAMVRGPRAGLDMLTTLESDPQLAGHHRVAAVRAHLLELIGDKAAARASYQLAARRTMSVPEQRYLEAQAARLAPDET
jgi:RNA polymerase sigma factor (sigma-70 family)